MSVIYKQYADVDQAVPALRLYIDGDTDVAAFKDLIQRGASLNPDLAPSMKELADLVTVGHIQQDYQSQAKG